MRIVFEDDNVYTVSPLNMANEIINALLIRTDELKNEYMTIPSWNEVVERHLDVCKAIEFLEIWRKQNQPIWEKEKEKNHVQ